MSRALLRRAWLAVPFLLGTATPAAAEVSTSYWVGDGEFADLALEVNPTGSTLWLTRKPTNEPVSDALVSIEGASGDAPLAFKATAVPGTYQGAGFDAATFAGHVVVEVGDDSDLIELAVPAYKSHPAAGSPPVVAASTVPFDRKVPLAAAAGAALALVLVGIVHLLGRRRLSQKAAVFLVGGIAAFGASRASAHEGHDHGPPPPATDSAGDGSIVLAKKSQLLIGLRTVPVTKSKSAGALRTFGHIMPKPQNDAVLLAPQPGFVHLAPGIGPGSRVRKGERLATIQGLGPIVVEAPIDGEIAEMPVVDGARIEAGARVARVVDVRVLWVDAKLFPAQLARTRGAVEARVTVEGLTAPIGAKTLGITTSVDETTRLGKVYLELVDPPAGIRIGSLATVVFAVGDGPEGWRLPAAAVLRRGGDMVVYVQTGPETFAARTVAASDSPEPGELVVTTGLVDDDRVVVQGNYQLMMKAP